MLNSKNRKYYLHRLMRKSNISVNSSKKTISLTHDEYDTMPTKYKVKLFDLQRTFNYNIQFKIPN